MINAAAQISEPVAISTDTTSQDYLKFFTTKEGADMLPYAYLGDDGCYDDLVQYSDDYYLFSDEVALIENNAKALRHYLSGIENIIEIGPGSYHTIQNKTIPILGYASDLKNYYALDHCENYLKNIADYIKVSTNSLGISTITADFRNLGKISLVDPGRSCVIFLGSTLGNFVPQQQQQIINQIAQLTRKGDLFIISMDTNQDPKSLLAAYNSKQANKFVSNILTYFSQYYPDFLPYHHYFEVVFKWNEEEKFIDIYFLTGKTFSFQFKKNGSVEILANVKLRGIKSYKLDQDEISKLFNRNDFRLLDILNYSNKMQMFLGERI